VKDLFRDLANSNLQRWFNGISCTRRRPRRADQAKQKLSAAAKLRTGARFLARPA
jgi:hypothetical protein